MALDKSGVSSATGNQRKFFYGYIVVIAFFFVMTVIHAVVFSYGVFFKPMVEEFGWSRAETSGAQSLSWFMLGVVNIVAGRLNDRFGPRVVMTVCGVLFGLGYILLSRIDAIWQLYLLYGVLIAAGLSGGFVPAMSTVAKWFIRRRGLMTGIVAAGVGAGTMFGAPIAGWLISSYGWRAAYLWIGVAALVLLLAAAQFLRRDPEQMGLLPYGHIPSVHSVTKQDVSTSKSGGFTLRMALRNRQFWVLCLLYICFGIGLQGLLVHIIPYATDLGMSTIAAANIMTVIGVVNVVGRIALGGVSDRIGNRASLVISSSFCLVSLVWLLWANGTAMLYPIAAVYGLGFAGTATIVSPVVAEMFGMRAHGSVLGAVTFVWATGSAIGPVLTGYLFDTTGSYHLAFVISAILAAVSLMVSLLLRPAREKAQWQMTR